MRAHAPIGPALVLAGLVAGILGGEAAGASDARSALVLTGAAFAAAGLVTRRGARLLIAVLAFAVLGTAVSERALHGLEVSPLTTPIARRAGVTARVTLVDDPDSTRFSTWVLVRVDSFAIAHHRVRDGGRRRVLVRASGDAAPRLRLLAAGERAVLRGWLETLSGFDRRWRWRHAVGTLRAYDLLGARPARSPLDRVANATRAAVLRGSETLAPGDRALLAGFLLGDTRGVPPAVVESFRRAGLTHLVAVSGENVAFVLALFAPILRRLSLLGRCAGGITVLVVFGTMTRWEPSVARAISMSVIALVAGYLGRPASGVRLLALAVIALLVVDPFLVHSVGFQLSCGASLGIALLARPITARLPGPRWFVRSSASRRPRNSAWHPCSSPSSAPCRSSRCPPTSWPYRWPRRSRCGGWDPASWAARSVPPRRK